MSDLSPAAKDAFVGFQRRSISFSREKQKKDSQVTGSPLSVGDPQMGCGVWRGGGNPLVSSCGTADLEPLTLRRNGEGSAALTRGSRASVLSPSSRPRAPQPGMRVAHALCRAGTLETPSQRFLQTRVRAWLALKGGCSPARAAVPPPHCSGPAPSDVAGGLGTQGGGRQGGLQVPGIPGVPCSDSAEMRSPEA